MARPERLELFLTIFGTRDFDRSNPPQHPSEFFSLSQTVPCLTHFAQAPAEFIDRHVSQCQREKIEPGLRVLYKYGRGSRKEASDPHQYRRHWQTGQCRTRQKRASRNRRVSTFESSFSGTQANPRT